jgi:hypothetical protein
MSLLLTIALSKGGRRRLECPELGGALHFSLEKALILFVVWMHEAVSLRLLTSNRRPLPPMRGGARQDDVRRR